MKSFPQAAAREAAGPLLVKLRDRYGESMEVNIYDPRCYFWIFDLIRFNIRAEPRGSSTGSFSGGEFPPGTNSGKKLTGPGETIEKVLFALRTISIRRLFS